MTSTLQKFDFHSQGLRIILIKNRINLIALDVCQILSIKNVSDALSKLDEDEKGIVIADTLGGPQNMITVNEAGLYKLIFKSRKKEAKEFKRWVCHEILPSLRQTGTYSIQPKTSNQMLLQAVQGLVDLEETQNNHEHRLRHLEAETDRSLDYFTIMGWYNFNGKNISAEAAKKLGKKVSKMSKENGIQIEKIPDVKYGTVNAYHRKMLELL